jgi:putative ABC transport system ATP-binding protein
MPIVAMENLCKTYRLGSRDLSVLRDLNLTIGSGEYVAIMGPSGSGKSTLLNLLGCLDRLSSGMYKLAGQDVSRLSDDELSRIRGSQVGFVFQSFNLIAQLNVIENVEVPMFYQRIPEGESVSRAKQLAEMVGLGDRLTHRPFELSGGEQQRVAIARALTNDPVMILADEPTGNLDSESGAEIMRVLDELHAKGKTLVTVTHDPTIAAKSQRIIHLLDGKIEREERNPRL